MQSICLNWFLFFISVQCHHQCPSPVETIFKKWSKKVSIVNSKIKSQPPNYTTQGFWWTNLCVSWICKTPPGLGRSPWSAWSCCCLQGSLSCFRCRSSSAAKTSWSRRCRCRLLSRRSIWPTHTKVVNVYLCKKYMQKCMYTNLIWFSLHIVTAGKNTLSSRDA